MSSGVLARILEHKRAEAERLSSEKPEGAFSPREDVAARLARPPGKPLRLLAEIKKRSPSAGSLSSALAPAERALAYARAGATGVSVLTDARFFDGSFEDLAACRRALDEALGSSRPLLLCKDFVLGEAQLDWARASGADLVLLIVRALEPGELERLAAGAEARGLCPLFEVATEAELDAALRAALRAEGRLIGVNARDLDTLVIDQERAARVLARAAREPGVVAVHLSGVASAEDVARLARGPASAALVGEALMRQDDPGPLLASMARAAS